MCPTLYMYIQLSSKTKQLTTFGEFLCHALARSREDETVTRTGHPSSILRRGPALRGTVGILPVWATRAGLCLSHLSSPHKALHTHTSHIP